MSSLGEQEREIFENTSLSFRALDGGLRYGISPPPQHYIHIFLLSTQHNNALLSPFAFIDRLHATCKEYDRLRLSRFVLSVQLAIGSLFVCLFAVLLVALHSFV